MGALSTTMNNQYTPSRRPRQEWAIGETVKVGFLQLRIIAGPIPTPGNYHADEWALESWDGKKFYRFTPHAGCFRCASREEAVSGPANY